jgi:hypothetical protein
LSDKFPERSTLVLNVASARRVPVVVALKFHAELIVIHLQIAITAARYRIWSDLGDFLRNHTNVWRVTAVIAEAIEAKAIVEITNQNDIVLKSDIRTPSATTAAATTTTTTAPPAAAAHCTTATTAARTHGAAATAAADVGVLSSASTMRWSCARALTATIRGPCSLAGTVPFADIGSAAAGLGTGARPVARFVAGTGSIARFEHLLAAISTEVALTSISGSLPMVDPRLPSVAAAGAADRMRGTIPGRGDVDIVAAAAPIDVATPIPA